MEGFERIAHDINVLGNKPSIRVMRIIIGAILIQISEGLTVSEILKAYSLLVEENMKLEGMVNG